MQSGSRQICITHSWHSSANSLNTNTRNVTHLCLNTTVEQHECSTLDTSMQSLDWRHNTCAMCITHVHNTQKKCSIHIYETQQCNSISKCKMHVCKAQLCIKFIYIYATHFAKTLGTVWQMLNHFNQLQTSFLFYFYSYPWLSRSSNILKHFSSQRSEQHNELSTCMEWKKMQGGWVAGVWGGILNKRPTMATCCTIIIAKARVKRYLVVKKLSPAIIQHSCQPARDTEVKKVPIIKNKKVFNCQSEKMPP